MCVAHFNSTHTHIHTRPNKILYIYVYIAAVGEKNARRLNQLWLLVAARQPNVRRLQTSRIAFKDI